jgi:thiosulfate/3-mercaptopyruvate sulfurtransferase
VVTAAELIRRRDGGTPVIDARAAERYRGESEPIDPRRGHVPGARSAPWSGNLDGRGAFLDVAALRERYAAIGIDGRSQPVAYCGSGVTAAHALLALHLAGVQGDLYEGSWSDWASREELPAASGPDA